MGRAAAVLVVALACVTTVFSACDSGAPAAKRERHVAIYNWSDYIGKTTIADFERESGITVEYDTFDSDSTLEAKMLAGGAGYDVVSTSENYFSRQIKAGAYQPLDRSRLPNWGNLDPEVLKILERFDPANAHAAPYLHSWTGFAYNVPMIRARMKDAPLDSLDMLFKPEVVKHFTDCGVTFFDGAAPVLRLALIYLGRNPDSDREEDLKAAETVVMMVRPYITHFDSDYINPLATGETCLAMAWSGDYAVAIDRAREAGIELPLKFTLPREGTDYLVNGWLIPFDAPHVAEAHEFINYMLRPDVIAKITNETHYPNEIPASLALLKDSIRNDPVLYPPPEVRAHAFVTGELTTSAERLRTRIWTHIKTAH